MGKEIPYFGTVSIGRSIYTLHYQCQPPVMSINCTGYGPDVFDGFDGPVIRFDLADREDVFSWLAGPVLWLIGYNCADSRDHALTMRQYLDRAREFRIPVNERGFER